MQKQDENYFLFAVNLLFDILSFVYEDANDK